MKLTDNPTKVTDEVITEVRAIKRAISQRHSNDIDRLLASLMAQERDAGIGQGEKDAAGKPTTLPESK